MMGIAHPLIYFPLYEKSKIYFARAWDDNTRHNHDPNNLASRYVVICAVTSKAITSALTYPHEVLRARLQDFREYEQLQQHQEEGNRSVLPRSQRTRNSLRSVATQIWREKGIVSFYDGFWVNLMRISPSYAITFVLYEKFCVVL